MEVSLKPTRRSLHVVHLGPQASILHFQLHDAPAQQVGLLLHQLQVNSDLGLPGVRGVGNLGGRTIKQSSSD